MHAIVAPQTWIFNQSIPFFKLLSQLGHFRASFKFNFFRLWQTELGIDDSSSFDEDSPEEVEGEVAMAAAFSLAHLS